MKRAARLLLEWRDRVDAHPGPARAVEGVTREAIEGRRAMRSIRTKSRARAGGWSVAVAAVALAAGACSILEPREDPTRLFLLTSIGETAAPAAPAASKEEPAPADAAKGWIGLGPVTVPSYLERPEIVRRASEHELAPARSDRWAEPLDRAVLRVLAQDLAQVTGRRVVAYPWKTALAPACIVAVDLTRFEAVEGKRVELAADVDVSGPAGAPTARRHEKIAVALAADDGGAIAKAMSAALAELAGKIAAQSASMDGGH